MHGLINRSIQGFLCGTYGPRIWAELARASGLPEEGFESLLHYDDALTDTVLDLAARRLDKPREVLLEDLGTYLVSNPGQESVRRLLRFSGETFVDFLLSLDDLPGRARLALPDLDLPDLELADEGQRRFRLACRWHYPGACAVMTGILRAMADDYGALVLLECCDGNSTSGHIQIELLDSDFASGRDFRLSQRAGAA